MVSPTATYEYTVVFGAAEAAGAGILVATAFLGDGSNGCTYPSPNAPVVAGFDVKWQ